MASFQGSRLERGLWIWLYLHFHRILREQWIRAKYERREFVLDADEDRLRPYTTGERVSYYLLSDLMRPMRLYDNFFPGKKKGFLFKKKKVDNVWQSRFFILDESSLVYYKKISVSNLR